MRDMIGSNGNISLNKRLSGYQGEQAKTAIREIYRESGSQPRGVAAVSTAESTQVFDPS